MHPNDRQGGQNPFLATLSPASKSLGPFEVLQFDRPSRVVAFPYRDVHGGNLIVGAVNTATPTIAANALTALTVEVEIVGLIQGVPSVLIRGVTRPQTGPIVYGFSEADLYDTIEVRARNMTGGIPGPNSVATSTAGFRLAVNVSLQPRLVLGGQYGRPMV